MPIPTFEIEVQPVNLLVLSNTDSVPLYFALYKLDDEGTGWDSVEILPLSPLEPDLSLPPDAVFQMILADNLYKIFISDSPLNITNPSEEVGYYVLADMNIKACKRELLLKNLCGFTTNCDNIADRKFLEKRLRFHDLEMGLYYIYSQWILKQAMTMLIVPTNQELQSMREYLDQLLDMCGCKSTNCKQCEGYISISNWKNIDSSSQDCGCSN